jgi:penicillin-binding protein 1A
MSRQSRKRRQRHRGDGASRVLIIGGGALAAALVVATIAAVAYVLNVAREAPALNTLRPILGGGSSQVFASDGTRLGFIRSDLLRSPVGWAEIPSSMKNATVAIEDQRFYKHNGVDLTGIFRAAIKDITHGAALQGGSTITMQLMRNLYLGGDQHTLRQKIIEAKLALDYEKVHNKRYILTAYLNSVPYGTVGGQTAVGVQAAARIFFNKPASQLTLAQSALLAGLPQAPSQYNPFRDPATARARRAEVLSKMAELHYISGAEASAAKSAPLEVHLGHFYSQRRVDFFFEYVRELLERR